jgi:thymidylate synthase
MQQIVDHLNGIHNYARQHLKMASDWMKTRYDKLANSAGYQESDRVWLYHPTHTKGKSPKLQSSWEGPYKVVTRINDVVNRIQNNPRSRMMVVHLDRLATYQSAAWATALKEGADVAV